MERVAGPTIEIFKARELTNRLRAEDEIAEGTMILGVCDSWMNRNSSQAHLALEEAVDAPVGAQPGKGYAGFVLFVNPVLQYKVVNKYSTATIQLIRILVGSVILTTFYISLGAR